MDYAGRRRDWAGHTFVEPTRKRSTCFPYETDSCMKFPEGYIAFVEELPGANTQGETIEEARANLEEAVAMVLHANRELSAQSLKGSDVIRETLMLPVA